MGTSSAWVVTLVVALASATIQAQSMRNTARLSLEDAIAMAVVHSRAVRQARLAREDARGRLDAARERYHPRAEVLLETEAQSEGQEQTDFSIGPRLRLQSGAQLSARLSEPIGGGARDRRAIVLIAQPLLKGFGPRIETASLRIAEMHDQSAHDALCKAIAQTLATVERTHRTLARAQRGVTIAREALERSRRQFEFNQILIEAGRMAEREIVQSQSEIAERELALTSSENALETAQLAMRDVLDMDGVAAVQAIEEGDAEQRTPILQTAITEALARRSDYRRARTALAQAEIELEVAKDRERWDLRLEASVAHSGGDETEYGARLKLEIPIGDGEPKRAVARARNTVQRARMSLEESEQKVRIEVREAVYDVEAEWRRIGLAHRARALAESKLTVERQKLEAGLSTSFQIGRFEDDLIRAQHRELDTILAYRNATSALDRVMGNTLKRWGVTIVGGDNGC